MMICLRLGSVGPYNKKLIRLRTVTQNVAKFLEILEMGKKAL